MINDSSRPGRGEAPPPIAAAMARHPAAAACMASAAAVAMPAMAAACAASPMAGGSGAAQGRWGRLSAGPAGGGLCGAPQGRGAVSDASVPFMCGRSMYDWNLIICCFFISIHAKQISSLSSFATVARRRSHPKNN